MKRSIKKAISVVLAATIMLCSAPLTGFLGLDLPEIGKIFADKAQASVYSESFGIGLTWELDTETGDFVISGTGTMTDWKSYSDAPWFDKRSYIKNITISDGVTNIGKYSFYDCNEIESIVIPESVETIASYAFNGCSSLKNITVPGNVKNIGEFAFGECGLKNAVIEEGVTVIGEYAFAYCTSLERITIPVTVTGIGSYAFKGCDSIRDVYYSGTETDWSTLNIGDNNTCLTSATIHTSIISYLTYTVDENGNATITGCRNTVDGDVEIPSEIDGYPVTAIGKEAFYACNKITSVVIPEGITSIGPMAFQDCKNLTDINLPEGLTKIEYSLFTSCESLKSVKIPKSVTSIGKSAFYGCHALETVSIPRNVTSIDDYVFFDCTNLNIIAVDGANPAYTSDENGVLFSKDKTSLICYPAGKKDAGYVIPNGVFSIVSSAFLACQNLKSITVPKSVISIGELNFVGDDGETVFITNVFYEGNDTQWSAIENNGILSGAALYFLTDISGFLTYKVDENGNATITDCDTSVSGFVSVPSTIDGYPVTAFGNQAFYQCTQIKSIVIPDGVTIIDTGAFGGCTSLVSVTIPEGVTSIGNVVFRGCTALEYISIPDSVTSIGSAAFNACSSLKSVVLPDSVAAFGNNLFQDCTALTDVTLSKNIAAIAANTFRNCYSLKTIVIPDSVTTITAFAFYGCSSLNNIVIPVSLTAVLSGVFTGCTALTDVYYRGTYSEWKSISVHSTNNEYFINATVHYNLYAVTWIADGNKTVDYYQSGEKIAVPASPVKNYHTFIGWDSEIPQTVTDSDLVFNAVFETVKYPVTWNIDGVQTVDEYNYGDKIIIPEASSKNGYTFVGWDKEVPETMPDNALEFTAIYELSGGSCGENITFEFDKENGKLTISGEGEITSLPWVNEKNALTSVEITDGVTVVPDSAFDGYPNLVSVTLPASLISIGNSAFTNCESLNDVYYADDDVAWSNVAIGTGNDSLAAADMHFTYTPEDCFTYTVSNGEATVTGYNSVLITDGVIVIPDVLENCPVTAIGEKAFYEKSEIVSVTIPANVKNIGVSAFGKCTSLSTVTISEGVESIGQTAFNGCTALTEITVPEGVTSIGSSAFMNCSALTQISIPSTVKNISTGMFVGCTSLNAVNISENNVVYSSDENGVLFSKDKTSLLFYPMGKTDETYTVPNGVTSIGTSAFKNTKKLKSVALPEGVTRIGTTAFAACSSLTTVYLPLSLVNVANGAFSGCSALADVYYEGISSEFNEIVIGTNNSALTSATLHHASDPEEYLSYNVTDGHAVITGCDESKLSNGRLVIPATIDGYPVKGIYDYAFYYIESITGIVLPDVPLDIGNSAFYGTAYYSDTDNWEDDALYIGKHLIKVNLLANNAFTVKEGTLSVADYAISNSNLYTVHIPDSVRYIGYNGTGYNSYLDYIFYSGTRSQWSEVELENDYYNATVFFGYVDSGFEDGYIYYYTTFGTAVITDGPDTAGVLEIPAILGGYPVTEIASRAFYNHDSITGVVIPETVTVIGEYAFYDCGNLATVELPRSLEIIDKNAFSWCDSLREITVPGSVSSIGENAFECCFSLSAVTIENGVETIEDYAFYNCAVLKEITVPDSVTSIGNYAFSYCHDLESVYIGSGLESISPDTFEECGKLDSVEISADNPNLTSENGVVFSKDKKTIVLYPEGKTEESYEIPAEVETVLPGAFSGVTSLKNLTVNVNNPNFVGVDGVLFSKDETVLVLYPSGKTDSVYVIPETVTTVASGAFYIYYSGLNYISVSKTLTAFEYGAFDFNSSLDGVYYQGSEEEWNVLAEGNGSYYSFGTVKYNCIVDDSGFIFNISEDEAVVVGISKAPEGKIVIPSQTDGIPVVAVGSNAFENCHRITEVVIPDSITEIGTGAFSYCNGLKTVDIPSSVKTIGSYAFDGCSALSNLTLNEGLELIGIYAFQFCRGLKTVDIPSSVKTIGSYAFAYCYAMSNLTLNEGLESINSHAFENCTGLVNVTIPDSVTTIESRAFECCNKLKTVKLGANTVINSSSFADCHSLLSFEVSERSLNYFAENGVLFSADKDTLILYPCGKKETSYEIPAYVENIKSGAFDDSKIKSFTVNAENDDFAAADGVLFSKDMKTLVLYPPERHAQIYKIPEGVKTIAANAFGNSYNYISGFIDVISIPSSVITIKSDAFGRVQFGSVFYGGTLEEWSIVVQDIYISYDKIYFNAEVNTEENGLIYYLDENSQAIIIGATESVKDDLIIPATVDGYPVKAIADEAFRNSDIADITIEDGVETIGYGAFYNSNNIVSITIPDSVTSLGESAFYSCAKLETVIIGSGITEIYNNTFADCYKMKTYEISENNAAYSSDENGILFNKDKTRLVSYPMGKTEESYEIPAFVTEVAPYALQGNENLKAITVNENNEYFASVDGVLFSKDLSVLVCLSVGTVESAYAIPDHVTSVATGAILAEDDFDYISIPKTVTTLSERAIITNNSLSAIYFGGTQAEWDILRQQNSAYINYGSIYFESSLGIDSCGLIYYINENSEAVIIDADETVKGDFVIPSSLGGCPVTEIRDNAFAEKEELTGIIIPDTVTSIGDEAFVFTGLTEIDIPAGVSVIGSGAFAVCKNLESVILHEGLQEINSLAFLGCAKLESVHIPASVTDLSNPFAECRGLNGITVENGSEHYYADENGVLYNADKTELIQYPLNSSATEFTIPDTVKIFDFFAFEGAHNLRILTIPASVGYVDVGSGFIFIGENFERFIVDENNPIISSDEQGALYNMDKTSLYSCPPAISDKNFVIPDTVVDIYDFAFFLCRGLTVTIPDSLNYSKGLDEDVFGFGSAKEYIVSETHPDLSTHKGALYSKDKTELIKYPVDCISDIHIAPESLESVYSYAFMSADYELVAQSHLMFLSDLPDYSFACDNLTFHAPKPVVYAFGIKQLCVCDAEEDDLQSVNEQIAEFCDYIRKEYDYYKELLESGNVSKAEECMFSILVTVYEDILLTADHVTVCGGNHSDVHVHEWVETVVNATCTTDGSITNICSVCDEMTVEVIPASHKPGEWITVTEPTTEHEGKKVKYCTVCEKALEEEILPKLDIPVTGIDLKETEAVIQNYSSLQLNASTVPAVSNNTKILWSSSNESVATVDENGVVTAVSVGNAIITATTDEGGFTAECVITVTPADFTVTLNVDGIQSFVTVAEGEQINIDDPVKEGWSFIGWSPEMPDVMPSENLEFTAVFEINSYTVEWNIDGLTLHESYQFGANIDKSKTFTKKGYTFAGWTPEIPDTMPAENLVFTAVWTANLYNAVFFTNGGSFPDGDSIKRLPTAYNTAISVPENPVKNGYEFAGWAYNGKNIGTDIGIMDSTDGKSFEAIWASNNSSAYRIETYTMNTVGEYEKTTVTLNADVYNNITLRPEAETGFVLNKEKSVLSGTVLSDEILVLKIYYDRLSYSLTVNVDGAKETVEYYYGAMISPLTDPVKDGYEFVGWSAEIPAVMPAKDITVTAIFKEKAEDKTYAKISIATPQKRTLYYGETITLYASAKNLPEGAIIKWYVEGDGVSIKPSAGGKSCKVTSTSNGNVVIRVTVLDAKGNTVKGSDGKPVSDYETIYSEVNLWQMIVAFFRKLFTK